jgi:hypothetical protein
LFTTITIVCENCVKGYSKKTEFSTIILPRIQIQKKPPFKIQRTTFYDLDYYSKIAMASEGKKTPKKSTPKNKSPLAPVIGKLARQRLFTETMFDEIKTSYEILKTLEVDTDKVNATKYKIAQFYMWENAMAELSEYYKYRIFKFTDDDRN